MAKIASNELYLHETVIRHPSYKWNKFPRAGWVHAQGRKVLKLSPETALGLFNLDHFELVRSKAANVKCIVAWSNHTLLVSFRGTANLANALVDVKVC